MKRKKPISKWSTFHKPNLRYDRQQEPLRLYIMLSIYITLVLPFSLLVKDVGFHIGFGLFCIVGLYRIHYSYIFPKIKQELDQERKLVDSL